ncbi:LemA family protein [Candidatus Pacearchaeota archaeon]|nr:LemA family protein [Candidatus Pacearchaeota archaeon]
MVAGLVIGLIIAAIILIIAFIFIYYYNKFTTLDNRINNSLSQIDVQLKKRADLIPALIKVVSGYAKHEKKILIEVTAARASLLKGSDISKRVKAGDALEGALGRLFAVAENYPQLKANENFLHLQTELSAIEDKVAYSRQYYNDSIMDYENSTEQFPGVFFFNLYKFQKKEYLKIPESNKEMPSINFEE